MAASIVTRWIDEWGVFDLTILLSWNRHLTCSNLLCELLKNYHECDNAESKEAEHQRCLAVSSFAWIRAARKRPVEQHDDVYDWDCQHDHGEHPIPHCDRLVFVERMHGVR